MSQHFTTVTIAPRFFFQKEALGRFGLTSTYAVFCHPRPRVIFQISKASIKSWLANLFLK